ncbi:hypothetical protein CsSME_00005188 [Camellia sinensis var. sinensis]
MEEAYLGMLSFIRIHLNCFPRFFTILLSLELWKFSLWWISGWYVTNFRYLLPDHVGSCHLRISYSAHTDLNIKFQSHRSRDYTNPYLPVNPTAIEGFAQPAVGPDGKKKEPESTVLLASIENMQYAVTVDVLHTVFSAFGTVQKIAIFEKNGGTQALIQYPDVTTAAVAKDALEGHCIYDGGYCIQ